MRNWSDLWNSPRNVLGLICILLVIWGVFNPERISAFLNGLFNMLVNQILPIVIIIAIIIWLIKSARGTHRPPPSKK